MSSVWTRRQLLTASGAFALAACAPRASADRPLDLWTLQLAPKFNPYFEELFSRWDRRHKNQPVRWTDLPWGSVERKLLAAVFARTAPDVVNLNPPFAANLASKGGLTDLNPLLPDGAEELYLPSVWQACRDPEAGQIALPWYLTVRLSLVNRQLLDQAGLELHHGSGMRCLNSPAGYASAQDVMASSPLWSRTILLRCSRPWCRWG